MKKKTIKAWGVIRGQKLIIFSGSAIPKIYFKREDAEVLGLAFIKAKVVPVTITYELPHDQPK